MTIGHNALAIHTKDKEILPKLFKDYEEFKKKHNLQIKYEMQE